MEETRSQTRNRFPILRAYPISTAMERRPEGYAGDLLMEKALTPAHAGSTVKSSSAFHTTYAVQPRNSSVIRGEDVTVLGKEGYTRCRTDTTVKPFIGKSRTNTHLSKLLNAATTVSFAKSYEMATFANQFTTAFLMARKSVHGKSPDKKKSSD